MPPLPPGKHTNAPPPLPPMPKAKPQRAYSPKAAPDRLLTMSRPRTAAPVNGGWYYYIPDTSGTFADLLLVEQKAGKTLFAEWTTDIAPVTTWNFLSLYGPPSSDQFSVLSIPPAAGGVWPRFLVRVQLLDNAPMLAGRRASTNGTWTTMKVRGKDTRVYMLNNALPVPPRK